MAKVRNLLAEIQRKQQELDEEYRRLIQSIIKQYGLTDGITFRSTQEYDDNNYFIHTRLATIMGENCEEWEYDVDLDEAKSIYEKIKVLSQGGVEISSSEDYPDTANDTNYNNLSLAVAAHKANLTVEEIFEAYDILSVIPERLVPAELLEY